MRSVKDLLEKLPKAEPREGDDDIMLNPEYLRKSSALISESLQKGFDVLQLENGDVITTGVKTIVTRYRWDDSKRKMTKVSARQVKAEEKGSRKVSAAPKKPAGRPKKK